MTDPSALRSHRPACRTPDVSVVVPTWEGATAWLGESLAGLAAQRVSPAPEILVVLDGPSPEAERVARRQLPMAHLLRSAVRRGFAQAANAGLRASKGALVALLNDDAVPEAGWLAALLDAASSDPDAGSFASRVLLRDDPGTIDSAGHGLTRWGEPFAIGHGCPDGPVFDVPRRVFGAPASAAAYRRELILDCGGFDAAMESHLEDVDLSLRAQVLGFPCLYVPAARVVHRGSASYGWGRGDGLAERRVARNRVRLLLRSMPRAALRAAWPEIAACLLSDLAQRTLRRRSAGAALAGTLDGARGAREALAGRAAVLGGRRAGDHLLREMLVDSEERLAGTLASVADGPWPRSRAALAARFAGRIDRREIRLAMSEPAAL